MKFLCDRCKTRYAIADERVRGKILKIRCKNCSAVITVREGMDETHEPTIASTPPPVPGPNGPEPPPPAALDEEWYVSRDGNQEGPFTLTEAQAWIAARASDDELFCWNEGFDDWLPVEKVSHFRGLRDAPRTRAATRPGAMKEPDPQPLFAATLAAIEAEAATAAAATAARLAATTGGAVPVPAAKNPAPSQWRTPGPPTGDETLDIPVPDAAQVMAGARATPARSQTPAVGVPTRPRAPAAAAPAPAAAAVVPALPGAAAPATPALPRAATPAIGVPALPRAAGPAAGVPALPRTATPAIGVPAMPRGAPPPTPIAAAPIAGAPSAATATAPTATAPVAPVAARGGMRLEPAAATPPPQRTNLPSPFGVSRTAPGVAAPQIAPHTASHAGPHAAAAPASPASPAAHTPPPSVTPAASAAPSVTPAASAAPSVMPAASAAPSVTPATYAPPPSAMSAAPIAALTPGPAAASTPAWSPPPPVANARPPSARFDNGASDDEAAADAVAAAPPAPVPSFGDDDLDIGEVSRVVKLADLGRAPAPGRAAAKPRAPTAGIGRGTGAVASFGANPGGLTAPAERSAGGFGGDVAPALDPAASLGAVPVSRRRSPVLYIGLGLAAVAIAVVAVVMLSGGGEDTSGNETAGGNDYDNLGYRPNDPVGRRPGSNDPGTGPGTAAIKPVDRGPGTGRRPGSSVAATTVDAGVARPDPGGNPALPDLSPDDVFAMSARMESGTRRCYERAMKADPFLKVSKIRATISVSATGPVSDVTLSTMAGTQLGTCLIAAIKRWPFKPSRTGIVSEFALVFEQK